MLATFNLIFFLNIDWSEMQCHRLERSLWFYIKTPRLWFKNSAFVSFDNNFSVFWHQIEHSCLLMVYLLSTVEFTSAVNRSFWWYNLYLQNSLRLKFKKSCFVYLYNHQYFLSTFGQKSPDYIGKCTSLLRQCTIHCVGRDWAGSRWC